MTLPCGARLELDLPDHLVGVSWETLWSRFEAIHDQCTVCVEDDTVEHDLTP